MNWSAIPDTTDNCLYLSKYPPKVSLEFPIDFTISFIISLPFFNSSCLSLPNKSVWSSASKCFSSSFVFSCDLSISVLNPKSSALVFFPDISKSVFIAVALSICSLSILSCFIDVFGTSVPIVIPPPIFSYLFLSSKSFTTTLLADTFNFSFSFKEPITAPMLVKFSISTFPPFLAI